MDIARKYLEGAIVLIFVYLVVTHYIGFGSAVNAVSSGINNSFKVLQGR